MPNMRALFAATAILLVLMGGSAIAGDHPYAGVWGEAGPDEVEKSPELFGENGCYNKFTQQFPDGSFKYYLVDHSKWLAERKVEYLLAQEGTCTVDGGGKSEKCAGGVIGEKQSQWFIAYQSADATTIRATYYENVFYFEKRLNGEPIIRHKCPFDMATIEPYITGKTIADCTARCRAFGKTEAAEFGALVDFMKAHK
jgi:hypothetical protein